MSRRLLIASGILCLLFIGLSQMADPKILGIHGEPERILFYAGSGILAGIFGIIALGSIAYIGIIRVDETSDRRQRLARTLIPLALLAVLVTLAIRSGLI